MTLSKYALINIRLPLRFELSQTKEKPKNTRRMLSWDISTRMVVLTLWLLGKMILIIVFTFGKMTSRNSMSLFHIFHGNKVSKKESAAKYHSKVTCSGANSVCRFLRKKWYSLTCKRKCPNIHSYVLKIISTITNLLVMFLKMCLSTSTLLILISNRSLSLDR